MRLSQKGFKYIDLLKMQGVSNFYRRGASKILYFPIYNVVFSSLNSAYLIHIVLHENTVYDVTLFIQVIYLSLEISYLINLIV